MTARSDEHERAKNLRDRQKRREERLAMELRANLRRRKTQARARNDEADATRPDAGDSPPEPDGKA